jgi:glycosyltransferase involved in cell wall biosynthesis
LQPVQGSRLAEIVRGAGFFVLPSDLEGLPLVMLEAMREGIPVIASDIAPHRQLIGNERGTLFRAGDRQSLIETLKSALDRPIEVAKMALKAKEYVNTNFTWEKITESNLNLYKKLLKMRKNSQKFETDLDLSRSTEALEEDGKPKQVYLSNANRVIQKWK